MSRRARGAHDSFGKLGTEVFASELEHEEWGIQIAEGREQSDSSRVELDKGSLGGKKGTINQKKTPKTHPRKDSWDAPIFQVFALWLMYTESFDNWESNAKFLSI